MTETMLERAVKAVETELGKQEMVLTDPLTLRRMMAERAVRAVLQAIREVDASIIEEGAMEIWDGEPCGPFESDRRKAVSALNAMIDSILSQSQEGKHP